MTLIGEGIDILKLVNKAQNADLYKQIGEWIEKVLDLQKRNDELKTERDELREQLRFKGILERVDGHTFVQGDEEEICPRCAEVDRRVVHLMTMSRPSSFPRAGCPECETFTQLARPMKKQTTI